MPTRPNQLANEISKTVIKRRPKRKHSTNLTKEIDKFEDEIPLGVAIRILLAIKLEKLIECLAGQIVTYKLNK